MGLQHLGDTVAACLTATKSNAMKIMLYGLLSAAVGIVLWENVLSEPHRTWARTMTREAWRRLHDHMDMDKR